MSFISGAEAKSSLICSHTFSSSGTFNVFSRASWKWSCVAPGSRVCSGLFSSTSIDDRRWSEKSGIESPIVRLAFGNLRSIEGGPQM